MTIKKVPFKRYNIEPKDDGYAYITLRLNAEERRVLENDMRRLRQAKTGTSIKQLMKIGSIVLNTSEMGSVIELILSNLNRNARLGIIDVGTEIEGKKKLWDK